MSDIQVSATGEPIVVSASGGAVSVAVSEQLVSAVVTGGQGPAGVVTASAPITYDAENQSVGWGSFANGTSLAVGTFDLGLGGYGGISLNCAVGYELNWQAGHLRSTADGGETAATICCDSPILWQGEESGVSIDATGIAFPDASLQTTAWTGTVDIGDVSNLQTTLDGKQKTITSGTASPTGGNPGDIYLQYTA